MRKLYNQSRRKGFESWLFSFIILMILLTTQLGNSIQALKTIEEDIIPFTLNLEDHDYWYVDFNLTSNHFLTLYLEVVPQDDPNSKITMTILKDNYILQVWEFPSGVHEKTFNFLVEGIYYFEFYNDGDWSGGDKINVVGEFYIQFDKDLKAENCIALVNTKLKIGAHWNISSNISPIDLIDIKLYISLAPVDLTIKSLNQTLKTWSGVTGVFEKTISLKLKGQFELQLLNPITNDRRASIRGILIISSRQAPEAKEIILPLFFQLRQNEDWNIIINISRDDLILIALNIDIGLIDVIISYKNDLVHEWRNISGDFQKSFAFDDSGSYKLEFLNSGSSNLENISISGTLEIIIGNSFLAEVTFEKPSKYVFSESIAPILPWIILLIISVIFLGTWKYLERIGRRRFINKTLNQIMDKANRIAIPLFLSIMNIPDYDVFWQWVQTWPKDSPLEIDGDYIVFNREKPKDEKIISSTISSVTRSSILKRIVSQNQTEKAIELGDPKHIKEYEKAVHEITKEFQSMQEIFHERRAKHKSAIGISVRVGTITERSKVWLPYILGDKLYRSCIRFEKQKDEFVDVLITRIGEKDSGCYDLILRRLDKMR